MAARQHCVELMNVKWTTNKNKCLTVPPNMYRDKTDNRH